MYFSKDGITHYLIIKHYIQFLFSIIFSTSTALSSPALDDNVELVLLRYPQQKQHVISIAFVPTS